MRINKYKGLSGRGGQVGFTLLELMIAVAVVAILGSIAIPAYRQFVIRGHRSEAKTQIMEIANREQQFLLANRAYVAKATLTASGYSVPASVAEFYNWDVTLGAAGAAPSFVITFTPKGPQISDGPLTLDNEGNKSPIDKWTK